MSRDSARNVAPDVIFTHWREDLHQDHRMVSELTWNSFRNHLILEYEIPKWDGDMGRPNVFMPLERSICERKIEHVLSAFPSQADKDWFTAEMFWGLLRLRGMEARSPSGYAEAFLLQQVGVELTDRGFGSRQHESPCHRTRRIYRQRF